MDQPTLRAYDQNPEHFCQIWLGHGIPKEIITAIESHFYKNQPTADIGSGSGRDTDWLNKHGYPCTGFDASMGLIDVAQKKFPSQKFQMARLPNLREIGDEQFKNVLCETVLMHLPAESHEACLKNLIRISKPGASIVISWRHALDSVRDEHERLYSKVDQELVMTVAKTLKTEVLSASTFVSSITQKPITQMILKKLA